MAKVTRSTQAEGWDSPSPIIPLRHYIRNGLGLCGRAGYGSGGWPASKPIKDGALGNCRSCQRCLRAEHRRAER